MAARFAQKGMRYSRTRAARLITAKIIGDAQFSKSLALFAS